MSNVAVTFSKKQLSVEVKILFSGMCQSFTNVRTNYIIEHIYSILITLTLINMLMKELPSHWQMGLLYDIACQLHHALLKWSYFYSWLPQLCFGISMFHAYGHQWVCQLWYHPQKGQIWGLSDGEGCECLWAYLRKLIPCLWVTEVCNRSLTVI
jgi:Kyakuja-Dileera-Zisupton transposase